MTHPAQPAAFTCVLGKALLLAVGLLLGWVDKPSLAGEPGLADEPGLAVKQGLADKPSPPNENVRPNILFMFTDDQPQNCLGAMGNDAIQTPHLDALARRGTLFNNAFVTTAICCSNRACILTGQTMDRHGIEDFKQPLSAEAFDQTYPALLREAGYRTGYLGKYAIGNPSGNTKPLSLPADRFDAWYGFPQSIRFLQKVDGEPRYLTEVMTEKAIAFLQSNPAEQPFCLTVAFKEPHGPFNYFDPAAPNPYENVELPPSPTFNPEAFENQPEFIKTSLNADNSRGYLNHPQRYQQELRTFYRTVTRADTAVGEILAALKRLKLDQNTIVIFSSDHGSLLGDHGLTGKWLMYENSIRVPLIILDPRNPSKNATQPRDQMALSIDLAPTMLSLAGIAPPASMQGRDLTPVLREPEAPLREDFYYRHVYTPDPPRLSIAVTEGVRTQRWKYIRYPETDPVYEQLFDLEHDPLELKNLAEVPRHASQLEQLRTRCDAH
ncbi:Arylsulfatase [Pirellulimonas nuda]|uniref:Arylsulfatase n=1 Tax=Pirellulimonas nuda TaxID=2528009 RepID=A0A518DBS4_9BACT|nr:sulfatase [Pirellulimonas nuda]QDU88935.1 Arylsulfatase [Pirellulimonas nuda]